MKITSVEFVKSVADARDIPRDNLSQIAFAGRSNVGKSSLINCLLNRKRVAKTSSTPGKTRLLNFFKINGNLYFVDLPGYGYAKAPKHEISEWQKLIESFFLRSQKLVKVVSLIDSRIGPTDLDRQLFDWVKSQRIPMIVVATKADKQSNSVLQNKLRQFSRQISPDLGQKIIPFSVRTGTGKQQLWREILN
ncbi:ribosome biogenesis GTP-binding protein YihA/YsxC [bacterium]|nr:ribosome biogenesis GTP-binding protein YihA/YsxC [bacterium]